jgi:hypothetical protein
MADADSSAFCPECWHTRGFHKPEGGCTVPFKGGCNCTRTEDSIVPEEGNK